MKFKLPPELNPTDKFKIQLTDSEILLPLASPIFSVVKTNPETFDYGKKPFIEYQGETYFAELVILKILLDAGWNGVWVETYGGTHFLKTMPEKWNLKAEHISIPEEKEEILKNIWKLGKTKACFDVFVWKDDQIMFLEAKRSGKDKLTSAQIRFIEGALSYGLLPEQLVIVEWNENIKNE